MENRREKNKKIGDQSRRYNIQITEVPEREEKTEWRKLSIKSQRKIFQN